MTVFDRLSFFRRPFVGLLFGKRGRAAIAAARVAVQVAESTRGADVDRIDAALALCRYVSPEPENTMMALVACAVAEKKAGGPRR